MSTIMSYDDDDDNIFCLIYIYIYTQMFFFFRSKAEGLCQQFSAADRGNKVKAAMCSFFLSLDVDPSMAILMLVGEKSPNNSGYCVIEIY